MSKKLSAQKLDEMIEEATVDCYDEEEAAVGIFTMVEENLRLPFKTTILGQEASVIKIEQGSRGAIYAVCKHKTASQRIPLEDLPLPSPPPKGAEWIDAYQHWLR